MSGEIGVVNVGSHSLALAVIAPDDTVPWHDTVDAEPGSEAALDALSGFADQVGDRGVAGVAHRIVHGGPHLTEHTVLNAHIRQALDEAAELAPLHVPPALTALDVLRDRMPDIPQVLCLDTVFHRSMPEVARTYPVPAEWRNRYGVRRYGFHGLSYLWATRRAASLLRARESELNLVLAHLGGGSSVCAVRQGVSQWTSMGFTPLEGLMMGTRSGSVDPGMLLWLQRVHGLSVDEISDALEKQSGLYGLSGQRSNDSRDLLSDSSTESRLALAVFAFRAAQEIAAATASLPRVDAVVFTGEIGYDEAVIRRMIAERLAAIGIAPDLADTDQDAVVSSPGVRPAVVVVETREDLEMAHTARRVLDNPHPDSASSPQMGRER